MHHKKSSSPNNPLAGINKQVNKLKFICYCQGRSVHTCTYTRVYTRNEGFFLMMQPPLFDVVSTSLFCCRLLKTVEMGKMNKSMLHFPLHLVVDLSDFQISQDPLCSGSFTAKNNDYISSYNCSCSILREISLDLFSL